MKNENNNVNFLKKNEFEKKDMTKRRISILISNNPDEEMSIQFEKMSKKEAIIINPNKEITEKEINNKEKYRFEEILKTLKANIVYDEDFFNYIRNIDQNNDFLSKKNIDIIIKFNQSEMENLKQTKILLLDKFK